jgi:hypothetical protein
MRNGDEIVWFWIGSHADYDRLYHNTKTLEQGQKMQQQNKKVKEQPEQSPQKNPASKPKKA